MAPKRSAPPPPPVDSSEETDSGSGTDESEEEIAQSPPSATTRGTAPPPQMVQQPESSDEEEEDEEEEEDDKAIRKAPPSATQNPPPPAPMHEESESEEEEEAGDTDDEAPQPELAPKQKVEEKQPPSNGDKKPAAPFQRWSKDDEVRILEALAAHRREHGKLPEPEELEAALAGRLDHRDCGRRMLVSKVKTLKASYSKAVMKGDLPSKDPDRRIFNLSKEVWGGGDNDVVPRDFGEMSRLYPYLAEEVKALETDKPGLFKREFGMMDDAKARALDDKIKKQKALRMKLELRRYDLTKEVTKTLMGLLE